MDPWGAPRPRPVVENREALGVAEARLAEPSRDAPAHDEELVDLLLRRRALLLREVEDVVVRQERDRGLCHPARPARRETELRPHRRSSRGALSSPAAIRRTVRAADPAGTTPGTAAAIAK